MQHYFLKKENTHLKGHQSRSVWLLAGFSARRRKEAPAPKVCCVGPALSSAFVRKQSLEFHLRLNNSDASAESEEEEDKHKKMKLLGV